MQIPGGLPASTDYLLRFRVRQQGASTFTPPVTFSIDNVTVTELTDNLVAGLQPDVVEYHDYDPFGMLIYKRTQDEGSNDVYRYGFNGKEKDNEVKGEGNSYDFGARMYDPRVGRFFTTDPRIHEFPEWNPYIFAANNPVRMVDVNGEGPGDRVKAARKMIGTKYKQEPGSYLRAGESSVPLEFMDCAEFVCRVLAQDKVTPEIMHMNSSSLKTYLDNKQKFIHSKGPKVGDVAVWDGHVGIVTDVDKNGNFKLIHARGKGKPVKENPYFISASQYRNSKFHGFYRPINETPDNKDLNAKTPHGEDVKAIKPEIQQNEEKEDNTIYEADPLPEFVIEAKVTIRKIDTSSQNNTTSPKETNEQPEIKDKDTNSNN